MSHQLITKIVVNRAEYYKLKEIEKQMKLINEEKKKQLKLPPLKTETHKNNSDQTIEQSGEGEIEHQKFSANFMTDEQIQKISNAVVQSLSSKYELIPKQAVAEQIGEGTSGNFKIAI